MDKRYFNIQSICLDINKQFKNVRKQAFRFLRVGQETLF